MIFVDLFGGIQIPFHSPAIGVDRSSIVDRSREMSIGSLEQIDLTSQKNVENNVEKVFKIKFDTDL